MLIQYTAKTGAVYVPHKYADGTYVVSKTRFKTDQISVNSYEEIKCYLDKGYKVRVSDPATRKSPSLVNPASLMIR